MIGEAQPIVADPYRLVKSHNGLIKQRSQGEALYGLVTRIDLQAAFMAAPIPMPRSYHYKKPLIYYMYVFQTKSKWLETNNMSHSQNVINFFIAWKSINETVDIERRELNGYIDDERKGEKFRSRLENTEQEMKSLKEKQKYLLNETKMLKDNVSTTESMLQENFYYLDNVTEKCKIEITKYKVTTYRRVDHLENQTRSIKDKLEIMSFNMTNRPTSAYDDASLNLNLLKPECLNLLIYRVA